MAEGNIILSEISTAEELDFVSRIECDKEIWYYEESVESDNQAVRKKYENKMVSKNKNSYDFVISIHNGENIEMIGIVQIWQYVLHRGSWEIGYGILPNFQGHGYGTESVKRILRFAFENLKAHKVVGMCHSYNQGSVKLMEKIGMRREGTFKQELNWNNQWSDQYFYALLDSEYFQTQNKYRS